MAGNRLEGARFGELLATKLPVDSCLPMSGLEQADRNWLQPVLACKSPRTYGKRFIARHQLTMTHP